MDVTVVVATYGDEAWMDLARQRAVPSARAQGVPVKMAHVASEHGLHQARNDGLAMVDTEFVCFLDADDELEPHYFERMEGVTADLRAPSVRYMVDGRPNRLWMPQVPGHRHACVGECLRDGNWLVIGTVARTEVVRNVGGFKDWPLYEDWDLFLRCYLAGATVAAVPRAVYRAHVRKDSRNRAPDRDARLDAHRAIAAANSVPVPA